MFSNAECRKALFSCPSCIYSILHHWQTLYDTTGCNFTSTLPILSYTSFFQPTTTCNLPILLLIEECSTDLVKWTSQNKLNFKKDKTELLYMYSKYNPQQCLPPLRFGTDTIQPAQSARNIGVILDSTIMTMLPHVDSVCKSAFYHLRNISRIRKFLSTKTTKILIHAFVPSKLDHCNSPLYNCADICCEKVPTSTECCCPPKYMFP